MTSSLPDISFSQSVPLTSIKLPSASNLNDYVDGWVDVINSPCDYIDCNSTLDNVKEIIGQPNICDLIDCEGTISSLKSNLSKQNVCDFIDCESTINTLKNDLDTSTIITDATNQALGSIIDNNYIKYSVIGLAIFLLLICILLIVVLIKVFAKK